MSSSMTTERTEAPPFVGAPPPGGGAVEAVVEENLSRGLTRPLALCKNIARLERDAPKGAVTLGEEYLEIEVLGGGGELGVWGRADVEEGN